MDDILRNELAQSLLDEGWACDTTAQVTAGWRVDFDKALASMPIKNTVPDAMSLAWTLVKANVTYVDCYRWMGNSERSEGEQARQEAMELVRLLSPILARHRLFLKNQLCLLLAPTPRKRVRTRIAA